MTPPPSPPWPDPAQPGVPMEPEKDGWHWVDGEPIWWFALERWWRVEDRHGEMQRRSAEEMAQLIYGGPVRTDADLATTARVHAVGFKAGVEAAKAEVAAERADWLLLVKEGGQHPAYLHACALVTRRLNALPIPNASALEAVIAQAIEDENRNPWKAALVEAMICWDMLPAQGEAPKEALHRLVVIERKVALDPLVSEEAAALVAKEREACARWHIGEAERIERVHGADATMENRLNLPHARTHRLAADWFRDPDFSTLRARASLGQETA